MVFGYDDGQLALISCGVRIKTPHEAKILGTDGMISIAQFWDGRTATLSAGGKEEVVTLECAGNGVRVRSGRSSAMRARGQVGKRSHVPRRHACEYANTGCRARTMGLKYPME